MLGFRCVPRGLLPLRICLVGLAVLSCLPTALVSGWVFYRLAVDERHQHRLLLAAQADQIALAVESQLQSAIGKLEVLGRAAAARRDQLASFHALATEVVQVDRRIGNVLLIDEKGEQLVNLRRPYGSPLPALNRPDLPLEALRDSRPVISGMAIGVLAGEPLTAVYVPITTTDGARYVIGAGVDISQWQQVLAKNTPAGMLSALYDDAANLITASDEHSHELPREMLGDPGGEGEPRGLAAARTQAARWTVVTSSAGRAQGRVEQQLPLLAALLVLAVALPLGAAVWLAVRLDPLDLGLAGTPPPAS